MNNDNEEDEEDIQYDIRKLKFKTKGKYTNKETKCLQNIIKNEDIKWLNRLIKLINLKSKNPFRNLNQQSIESFDAFYRKYPEIRQRRPDLIKKMINKTGRERSLKKNTFPQVKENMYATKVVDYFYDVKGKKLMVDDDDDDDDVFESTTGKNEEEMVEDSMIITNKIEETKEDLHSHEIEYPLHRHQQVAVFQVSEYIAVIIYITEAEASVVFSKQKKEIVFKHQNEKPLFSDIQRRLIHKTLQIDEENDKISTDVDIATDLKRVLKIRSSIEDEITTEEEICTKITFQNEIERIVNKGDMWKKYDDGADYVFIKNKYTNEENNIYKKYVDEKKKCKTYLIYIYFRNHNIPDNSDSVVIIPE
eukprot:TRINITY_DN4692_c0_g1_i3.p1 TRINITY_DN4692_c0_g1~~TRINITY_DN4692_c0_g1_i3.p1  ORF type:complete len:363 (-),score=90.75 TRINITY_DN4692_c0_g1_i3:428-1516(-)